MPTSNIRLTKQQVLARCTSEGVKINPKHVHELRCLLCDTQFVFIGWRKDDQPVTNALLPDKARQTDGSPLPHSLTIAVRRHVRKFHAQNEHPQAATSNNRATRQAFEAMVRGTEKNKALPKEAPRRKAQTTPRGTTPAANVVLPADDTTAAPTPAPTVAAAAAPDAAAGPDAAAAPSGCGAASAADGGDGDEGKQADGEAAEKENNNAASSRTVARTQSLGFGRRPSHPSTQCGAVEGGGSSGSTEAQGQEKQEEEQKEKQEEEQEQQRNGPRRKGKNKEQQPWPQSEAELEYSATEILAINNAILAVGDAINSTIFSCESGACYNEWYNRVAVRVQEELRKNQEYMKDLDARFGRRQMRHLLLWFQDQKELERKAQIEPTSDVSAGNVEIIMKNEICQPSDEGTALAGGKDAGGSGLGKTNPYLYDTGMEPHAIVIGGTGSGAGRKNKDDKRLPSSDREGGNDGGLSSKPVGVKKRINVAASGQGSSVAEGEGIKKKRPNVGTESDETRTKRRRCSSIGKAIGTPVESRGGGALSGAASESSGSIGHASRVKELRDLYHDAQSARSNGHATDDVVKTIFDQYCDYVLRARRLD